MKFVTNYIPVGKQKSFDDIIKDVVSKREVKTASVKVAEKDEADSSGQLDVEPLHQKGESTTMPKNGPSAKKDEGTAVAASPAGKETDEAPDSGQPKAEGSEKFTNDPEASSKKEKGGSGEKNTKESGRDGTGGNGRGMGPGKGKGDGKGDGTGTCDRVDKDEDEDPKVKKAALEDLPQDVQDKIKGKSTDDDSDDDSSEEKEAATKCDVCDCLPCECEKKASSLKYVKIANLDSKTRAFLKKYWGNIYPQEYVDYMLAEK